jgi:hypothetical protein
VKRVPEVELQNDFLDSDFADILDEENLTEAEQRRLENPMQRNLRSSSAMTVWTLLRNISCIISRAEVFEVRAWLFR